MPPIDVPLFTDPAAWATYLAAIKQADAATEAANIAAQASWDAAVLQVSVGAIVAVAAACAALKAGWWTYKAAIKSADTQVKLETEKHEARVAAYAVRQSHLIGAAMANVDICIDLACYALARNKDEDANINGFLGIVPDLIPKFLPEDWNDTRWEEHALLGRDFIIALIFTRMMHLPFSRNLEGFNLLKRDYYDDQERRQSAQKILKDHTNELSIYKISLERLKDAFPEKYRTMDDD